MSKYSLQYRAARRRAFTAKPLSQKTTPKPVAPLSSPVSQSGWQQATYIGFNPDSGLYQVRNLSGEVSEADKIPGYGAEFGGTATGSNGLLSQGFWSS